MKIRLISVECILSFSLSIFVTGSPYKEADDIYDYENESNEIVETVVNQTPAFVSSSMAFVVNEGDTIRLPCIVDRLEGFVMLWKKNGVIITVAEQIIDKRVRLDIEENGNHLIIGQASPAAKGNYTCQISAFKPTEVTHTVTIREKPIIQISPNKQIDITSGESVTLTCTILQGSPTPKIKWKRKQTKLPNGNNEHIGKTLTLSSVDRHYAGHYVCEADNGYSTTPVTEEVEIKIKYPPEVEQNEVIFQTSHGDTQEMACNVHASPRANVTWTKNGELVTVNSSNIILNQAGHRYSLTLTSITQDMLGTYHCRAENELGESMKDFSVSGMAAPPTVNSSNKSFDSKEHTLQWTVDSKSPVSQFKVFVKKEGDKVWKTHETKIYEISEENHNGSYFGELKLTNLSPGTKYNVKFTTRNSFGFNDPSEVFSFSTLEEEPVHQPSVLTSGSLSSFNGHSFLASLTLLCLIFIK